MFLFFFGDNIYKSKETFKIFPPQILDFFGGDFFGGNHSRTDNVLLYFFSN